MITYKEIYFAVFTIIGIVILCTMMTCVIFYFYNLISTPYDDLESYLEKIECDGNHCNITMNRNVTGYYILEPTASMLPIAGGNDWVLCVEPSEISLGSIVIANNVMHQVYEIDGDFIQLKGFNNEGPDEFKFPADKVTCVVAAVFR